MQLPKFQVNGRVQDIQNKSLLNRTVILNAKDGLQAMAEYRKIIEGTGMYEIKFLKSVREMS